jgi:hypothetical protein
MIFIHLTQNDFMIHEKCYLRNSLISVIIVIIVIIFIIFISNMFTVLEEMLTVHLECL